ncbi:helix-turn-helix domain-containing protein [Anaeromicropila herbilytica]|uniref:HTH cro/C1-type domain-containing protein n=1 Tax=Anaeromicropila herbilytica TaxID=2785025 RepID=A0A7R7EHH7_9FIRM|nr:helix-turn-helix transcriptional regulator [Anaeromicropila herbilytica]BCN28830.1 hypothetical protein bsdtb5_01250 [Anaeromicropila herbilytica]
MTYYTLGELLKSLRESKNLSQEDTCKGICDRRTYIRWEKNEVEPSNHNLHLLSNRLNYDIQAYYKFLIRNTSPNVWDLKQNAESCIDNEDWAKLLHYIHEMEQTSHFKTSENAALLCYYKALYNNCYLHNYTISLDYCVQGLQYENPSFSINTFEIIFYSNTDLCLLNCLACNLNKLNRPQEANHIFSQMIQSIDKKLIPEITYYQSTEFETKIYQIAIYNLTLNYQRCNDHKTALHYIEKGIQFLLSSNSLYNLANLLKLKFKTLYALENYKESSDAYKLCLGLYQLENKEAIIEECKSSINSDYPKLLSYL